MYPIHPFWRSTIFVAYILSQYVQIHHWTSILLQIIAFLYTNDEMHAPRKPKEETFAVKKYMHQIHSVSLQSVLSKTQDLSKIRFWREMLWDWSKIFFNCSSSLEISVESLELGLCKVLSKLTSEIRETTLVTILWMRLSLRVARARAEQWGRPRHHSVHLYHSSLRRRQSRRRCFSSFPRLFLLFYEAAPSAAVRRRCYHRQKEANFRSLVVSIFRYCWHLY